MSRSRPMDRTDFELLEGLQDDPRVSYRKLADRLDLSVNSVHKRIQHMIDLGIIPAFIATLGPAVESYTVATAWGKTTTDDQERTISELGRDDHTRQIVEATNDFLYLQWYLRDISELDDLIAFAKESGGIEAPQVTFTKVPVPPGSENVKLSGMDYRIIDALMTDSRRPLKEVSEELDASQKTIRRRLAKMRRESSIYLTTRVVPTSTPDIFSFFHIYLEEGTDRREAGSYLREKYDDSIVNVQTVDNLPYFFLLHFWTQTMKDLKVIRTSLAKEEIIKSFFVNIFYDIHVFDTWREDLVRKRAAEAARRG